jgi:hypothetical protein
MIRSILLDWSIGVIDFPKRVKILSLTGVLNPLDEWRFKTPDLAEMFVDANGNNFSLYEVRIGDTLQPTSTYVKYCFENWNITSMDFTSSLGTANVMLTFEDYD